MGRSPGALEEQRISVLSTDTFSLASSTLTLLEETLDLDELPAAAGGKHYNF